MLSLEFKLLIKPFQKKFEKIGQLHIRKISMATSFFSVKTRTCVSHMKAKKSIPIKNSPDNVVWPKESNIQ